MNNNDRKQIITLCHSLAKRAGWWNYRPGEDPLREKLLLIFTEIAEAEEVWGSDRPDEHLPKRICWEVEFADIFIRTCDLLGYLGQKEAAPRKIASEVRFSQFYWQQNFLNLNRIVKNSVEAFRRQKFALAVDELFSLLFYIERWAREHPFQLKPIVLEKLEYNRTRADHKPENRQKAGGKKF